LRKAGKDRVFLCFWADKYNLIEKPDNYSYNYFIYKYLKTDFLLTVFRQHTGWYVKRHNEELNE